MTKEAENTIERERKGREQQTLKAREEKAH